VAFVGLLGKRLMADEAVAVALGAGGTRGFLKRSGMVLLGLLEGKSCFLRAVWWWEEE